FPSWIDIYGEESCVSIEVIKAGFDILYSSDIKVNHRINKSERLQNGNHYRRFGKQLKNTTLYYLVYYKYPLFPILKLYRHNFRKYAIINHKFFLIFIKTIFATLNAAQHVLKFRKPVNRSVIHKL